MKRWNFNLKVFCVGLIICVACLVAIVMAATSTSDTIYPAAWTSSAMAAIDANNFTLNLGTVQGKLTGVVIKPTGIDTSYKVYVKDEYSSAVFSKTDCNSVAGTYRYAITAANTAGTHFLGVPVSGDVTVQVVDANGLTGIEIKVYYDPLQAYGL